MPNLWKKILGNDDSVEKDEAKIAKIQKLMEAESPKRLALYQGLETVIGCILFVLLGASLYILNPVQIMLEWQYELVALLPSAWLLLPILPAIFLIMMVVGFLASFIVRRIYEVANPGKNSLVIFYNTQGAITKNSAGYQVNYDQDIVIRKLLISSLILYAASLAIYYANSDFLTKTHYHQRSILFWANEVIPNEDLTFKLEAGIFVIEDRASEVTKGRWTLSMDSESAGQQLEETIIQHFESITTRKTQE